MALGYEELLKALSVGIFKGEVMTPENAADMTGDASLDPKHGIPDYFLNHKIKRAVEFAEIIHYGQKYGKHPYTKHLADVYKVFLEFVVEPVYGKDNRVTNSGLIDKYQDIVCAIWLHDAIEDTSTTKDEIEEHFGPEVAELVWCVSGEGANRKERLASVAKKIEDRSDAVIIKLCDRIANTRSSQQEHYSTYSTGRIGEEIPKGSQMFAMYVKEFPSFKEQLGGVYTEVGFVVKMWHHLESISKE